MPRQWPPFSGQSTLPSLPIYHQCAAHVSPHAFAILEKFCIFSLAFGQNFSSQDAKFPNFRSQDPLFFKENPLPRLYFWNPHGTYPRKKKVSAPPPGIKFPQYNAFWDQFSHFSEHCILHVQSSKIHAPNTWPSCTLIFLKTTKCPVSTLMIWTQSW